MNKGRLLSWLCCACALMLWPSAGSASEQPAPLRVVYFECGKADAILIQAGEFAAMIDTATEKEGKKLPEKLAALGVTHLDALFITHPHKDHIGGADHILENLQVDQVLLGPLLVDTKQSGQFVDVMQAQGKTARIMQPGETLALGEGTFTCLGPLREEAEDENDLSLILRLDFGEVSFLFTGDAERPALIDLMTAPNARDHLRVDVLKVPHHGGAEKNSADFFRMTAPRYAVMTTQRGTQDHLPDAAVVQALEALDVEILYTDEGDVVIESDGQQVWVAQ